MHVRVKGGPDCGDLFHAGAAQQLHEHVPHHADPAENLALVVMLGCIEGAFQVVQHREHLGE